MKHVFLSGHGGWTPQFGYTTVPRGMAVYFYTHFAKALAIGMEELILTGAYTATDRIIGEFLQCPNMRLSGQPAAWTALSEASLNKDFWGEKSVVFGMPEKKRFHLSGFLAGAAGAMQPGDQVAVHWMACSSLQLNPVGGAALGVNAADLRHDTQNGHYRITNPDDTFRWLDKDGIEVQKALPNL